MIPYGRQTIDEDDIKSVVDVLRSDWLTTGPKVEEFENAVAEFVGAKHAVAVSSGTAALHAAMYAIGIKPGDEVIVPPITFAATANCVVYQGGTPVFVDVDPGTLLLDPAKVEEKVTKKTRAIIGVDYAGQPCDWDKLREIADKYELRLVADGCHALGAEYKGRKVGTLADMTIFSFHPVKHITTGEGGTITTDNVKLAERMRLFRTHGITRDTQSTKRKAQSDSDPMLHAPCSMPFYYEMVDIGYNYRITDIQCALGISQLKKLPGFLERRREIAARYDEALKSISGIEPLSLRTDVLSAAQSAESIAQSEGKEGTLSNSTPSSVLHVGSVEFTGGDSEARSTGAPCSLHAYHLYVIRIDSNVLGIDRSTLFAKLQKKGIGVNVHYIPVHLHPFYREKFHTGLGLCPVAEAAYEKLISIPMFPGMTEANGELVVRCLKEASKQ
jgi:perosamine synthetase